MTTRSGDLSFDQARDVYSAFYAAGHAEGKSEAKVFGELSLDERKVIVRAIEVLGERKGTTGSALVSGDRLTPLIEKLVGFHNLTRIEDADLPNALKASKPILVQGRAEIGMANRFLAHDKFLNALEPEGEFYQKLAGFFNNPHASQKTLVKKAVKEWVENLPAGEGKEAAIEALPYLEASIDNFSSAHGFALDNLKEVIGDFRGNIHKALVVAWGETPITKADHQAMGIGALDLLPFYGSKNIKQKRAEFEGIVKDIEAGKRGLEERLSQLERELLPMARYPEYAGLYSRVVGEHVNLLRESEDPQVGDRAIELKKIQYMYAMYAAAKGNGEGACTLVEGIVDFGLWTKDERENTLKEGLKLVTTAINAAKKGGNKELLAKAAVLRAMLYGKNYLALLELRNASGEPQSVKEAEKYAIAQFVKLGLNGAEGLYDLFVKGGVSADPMINLLETFMAATISPLNVKPSAEHVKWITQAALAGNEKAKQLLDKLVKLYPADSRKVPALLPAALLVKDGVYTDANVAEFKSNSAFHCYRKAFDHLANELEFQHYNNLEKATLDSILSKLEVLRNNYTKLLGQYPRANPAARELREDIKNLIQQYSEVEFGVEELPTPMPAPGVAMHMDVSRRVEQVSLRPPQVKPVPVRERFFNAISKFFSRWAMPNYRKTSKSEASSKTPTLGEPTRSPEPADSLDAVSVLQNVDSKATESDLVTTIYDQDNEELRRSVIDKMGDSLSASLPVRKEAPLAQAAEVEEDTQALVNGFEQFWDATKKDGVQLRGFVSTAGQDEMEKTTFTTKQKGAANSTRFMDQVAGLRQLDKNQQSIAIRLIANKMGNVKFVNFLTKLLEDDRFAEVQALLAEITG